MTTMRRICGKNPSSSPSPEKHTRSHKEETEGDKRKRPSHPTDQALGQVIRKPERVSTVESGTQKTGDE